MTPNRSLEVDSKRVDFEATALPYMSAIYNAALRLTRGSDDAADLVQETFLRAYRTYENFAPGTNCRGWLFTILYSVFYNAYHTARRQPASTSISVDDLEGPLQRYLEAPDDTEATAASLPVAGASGVRMNPEVALALGRLPDEFRAAVLFVDVEGLSYDEAAMVLACPVGTVRSRLYRGRRLLFGALQQYAATLGFARGGR